MFAASGISGVLVQWSQVKDLVGVCSQAQRPSRLPYSRRGLQGENHWPGAVMPGASFDPSKGPRGIGKGRGNQLDLGSLKGWRIYFAGMCAWVKTPMWYQFKRSLCWFYVNKGNMRVSIPQFWPHPHVISASVSSGLFSWQQFGTVHSSEWTGCSFTLDPELLPPMFFFLCVCVCVGLLFGVSRLGRLSNLSQRKCCVLRCSWPRKTSWREIVLLWCSMSFVKWKNNSSSWM